MSHAATNWLASVTPEKITSGEFRVLFHLCDCHNPSNGCFPTQEYLRGKTGLSNGGLNKCLSGLEEKGLIQRHKRFNSDTKRQKPTRYMLGFEYEDAQDTEAKAMSENDTRPQDVDAEPQDVAEPTPLSGDGILHSSGGGILQSGDGILHSSGDGILHSSGDGILQSGDGILHSSGDGILHSSGEEPVKEPVKEPVREPGTRIRAILCSVLRKKTAEDFIEHRKQLKKPITELAAERIVKKLKDHPDPDSAIDDSIANGWLGVFPKPPDKHPQQTGNISNIERWRKLAGKGG